MRMGDSGRGGGVPSERTSVSTPADAARARSAPTVHCSRGITENGS